MLPWKRAVVALALVSAAIAANIGVVALRTHLAEVRAAEARFEASQARAAAASASAAAIAAAAERQNVAERAAYAAKLAAEPQVLSIQKLVRRARDMRPGDLVTFRGDLTRAPFVDNLGRNMVFAVEFSGDGTLAGARMNMAFCEVDSAAFPAFEHLNRNDTIEARGRFVDTADRDGVNLRDCTLIRAK